MNMRLVAAGLAVSTAIIYLSNRHQAAPAPIANPVYVEAHVNISVGGRGYEQMILVKTIDRSDCDSVRSRLEDTYGPDAARAGEPWRIQSMECKAELAPRYAKLFDNQPTSVTYLSMDRGDASERETRMVTWGVTVSESEKLCEGFVGGNRLHRKGALTCVHAVES